MKTIKFWDNISAIIFLIGALIFGTQCFFQQSFTLISGLGISIVLLGIIISIVKVRCPFCGHYLGFSRINKFCSWCGCDFKKE